MSDNNWSAEFIAQRDFETWISRQENKEEIYKDKGLFLEHLADFIYVAKNGRVKKSARSTQK
ncbi:MAG: hypothetical protein HQ506_04270 [Candidatus Marinimicrobia bacterium]|nr:hypothetical protein [Candidatus Neomarinimicrobiota bacterium]